MSGWSRGVPTIQRNTEELYLYRPSSGALKKVLSEDAPRRWRASTRYTMQPRHLPAWPEASAEESAQLRQCTAMVGSEEGRRFIAIGPTGGPWRPVLELTGHRLVPWQTRP